MAKARTEPVAPGGRVSLDRDMIWPIAIAVALALVVLVNAVFIWIAVRDPDPIAPSYVEGER